MIKYTERELRILDMTDEERGASMLADAKDSGGIAKAAQDGDFDSAMQIFEGILATAMMCEHPVQEIGAFAGGLMWMARVVHDLLGQMNGRLEFGVTKATMMPLLGVAQAGLVYSAFEEWKTSAVIRYETDDNHRQGIDIMCDVAREAAKKIKEVQSGQGSETGKVS